MSIISCYHVPWPNTSPFVKQFWEEHTFQYWIFPPSFIRIYMDENFLTQLYSIRNLFKEEFRNMNRCPQTLFTSFGKSHALTKYFSVQKAILKRAHIPMSNISSLFHIGGKSLCPNCIQFAISWKKILGIWNWEMYMTFPPKHNS